MARCPHNSPPPHLVRFPVRPFILQSLQDLVGSYIVRRLRWQAHKVEICCIEVLLGCQILDRVYRSRPSLSRFAPAVLTSRRDTRETAEVAGVKTVCTNL